MATNFYQTLGVGKGATPEEIKKAYRKLAKKHHPDANPGDASAETRFKAVSAAWDALGDPDKRRLYDEFGDDSLHTGFDPERARAHREWQARPRPNGRDGGPGGLPFNFEDLFSRASGGAGPRRRQPRGADFFARVQVNLMDAIRGTELPFDLPVPESCAACQGTGRQPSVTPVALCAVCNGEGTIPAIRQIRVRLPPGAKDGERLTVRGQGAPGPRGDRGNLVLEIRVQPHAVLTRDELDLTMTLPLTVDEAYAGAEVEVPTPRGGVRLRIQAGTQSGSQLRLRGKGVTRAGKTGDLFVVVHVRLPEPGDTAFAEAARGAQYAHPVRDGLVL